MRHTSRNAIWGKRMCGTKKDNTVWMLDATMSWVWCISPEKWKKPMAWRLLKITARCEISFCLRRYGHSLAVQNANSFTSFRIALSPSCLFSAFYSSFVPFLAGRQTNAITRTHTHTILAMVFSVGCASGIWPVGSRQHRQQHYIEYAVVLQ